jgi:hypothetical protein
VSLARKLVFPGNRRIGSPRLGSKLPLNAKEGQVPVTRSKPLQLAASLVLFDAASVQKPKPRDAGGALDAPIIEGEGAGGLTGRVQTINPHLWLPFRPNLHLSESPGGPFLNPTPRLRVLMTNAVGREPSLKGYTHGAENREDLQAMQPPDGDGDKHGSEWKQSGSRYLVLRVLWCGG